MNNQKQSIKMNVFKCKLLIIAMVIPLFLCSCFNDGPDCHFRIPFKNNSDHSVYVYPTAKENYLSLPHFRDTILQPFYNDPSLDSAHTKIRAGEEKGAPFFMEASYENMFGYEFDTLLVFIFNADTLDTYGWDTVRAYYKVEQRYDLSLENIQNLDFKLSFPPTEAMKHIHMWPPYGTYDEHGRRKDTK